MLNAIDKEARDSKTITVALFLKNEILHIYILQPNLSFFRWCQWCSVATAVMRLYSHRLFISLKKRLIMTSSDNIKGPSAKSSASASSASFQLGFGRKTIALHHLFKKIHFNSKRARPLREHPTLDEVFPFSWGGWWFGLYPERNLRHRLKRSGPIWHGKFKFISMHSFFCAWESARASSRSARAARV